MDERKQKGKEIAFDGPRGSVQQLQETIWLVKGNRDLPYRVDLKSGGCTCPDKQTRNHDNQRHRCKHFWAVFYTVHVPIEYKVKPVDKDAWGNERWSVAFTRLGIEFMRIGPYYSQAEAYDAKWELEGVKNDRSDTA